MGRLFWKIFLWFWLALLLLNLAVGWGVKIHLEQTSSLTDTTLKTQVAAIASAFRQGSSPDALALLVAITRENRSPIFVIDDKGEDVLSRRLPPMMRHRLATDNFDSSRTYTSHIQTPNGTSYRIIAPRQPPLHNRLTRPPIWLALTITLIVSTLVCYLLAAYLSTPIRRLSEAARQLAAGQLEVRIGALKRRDELADLAQDFDQMAVKIQQLLGSHQQLLQDISHELRSPLARLQVALALAQRHNAGDSSAYERIKKDLDRLETLIGEVLTLSRLDAVTYPKEPVQLGELIADIAADCEMEAQQKPCAITVDLDQSLKIHGSAELLRRAVENILRNAIKFSPRQGRIAVILAQEGNLAIIRVSDQGPGIPQGSEDSLFEPFVRLDPAREHKSGGYGLGLAIARKAVELHGGHIAARNGLSGGLEISMQLPLTPGTI